MIDWCVDHDNEKYECMVEFYNVHDTYRLMEAWDPPHWDLNIILIELDLKAHKDCDGGAG